MKILIVDVYGSTHSTGKITTMQYNYFKSKGYDVRVCYRGIREPKMPTNDYIPLAGKVEPVLGMIMAKLTGYEGYFHPFATKKLKSITLSFKPDIVQLNILHGYFINGNEYIHFLKKHDFPVCYTMMDEYAYMGKCPFSYSCNKFKERCADCPETKSYPKSLFFDRSAFIQEAKRKAYEGYKNIVFTAPEWVVNRAKSSFLLKDKRVEILDEPINFEKTFYPRETSGLRKKLGISPENKVILTVAPLSDPRKGGIYFYQLAEAMKEQTEYTFVYIGCNTKEPMHLDNLIPIPFVSSQDELAEYYSLGDLFVCTSLADTMPNVCLDAMGCGTPLAGFAESGTPFVAPKEFGVFTKTYDINALKEVVLNTPKKDEKRITECREYAVGRYSEKVIFPKLEKMYESLLKNK